jgi:hypothetical protein
MSSPERLLTLFSAPQRMAFVEIYAKNARNNDSNQIIDKELNV